MPNNTPTKNMCQLDVISFITPPKKRNINPLFKSSSSIALLSAFLYFLTTFIMLIRISRFINAMTYKNKADTPVPSISPTPPNSGYFLIINSPRMIVIIVNVKMESECPREKKKPTPTGFFYRHSSAFLWYCLLRQYDPHPSRALNQRRRRASRDPTGQERHWIY